MNNNASSHRVSTLPACALAAAFCFMTAAAAAQTASTSAAQGDAAPGHASAVAGTVQAAPAPPSQPTQDAPAAEQEVFDLPHQVGDSTLSLFAWQRSGEIASRTARPIAGAVAGRSYERYLKSFEHPIPERLGSTVTNAKSGSGASGTTSR